MVRDIGIVIAQLIALMPDEETEFKKDMRKLIHPASIRKEEEQGELWVELGKIVNNYVSFYLEEEWLVDFLIKYTLEEKTNIQQAIQNIKEHLAMQPVH